MNGRCKEHRADDDAIKRLFFATGSIAFLILLHLQTPDLSWGESAILTLRSFSLGGAHPSGYPFMMMLMHPVRFLPIGDQIFRSNIFGILMNTLAIGGFAALSHRLLRGAWIFSFLGAILLLISPAFLTACQSIEVYSLNLLMIIGMLIIFSDTLEPRRLLLGALLAGLASAHHLTIVFVLMPLFGGALMTRSVPTRIKLISIGFLMFAMSTELFLILRDTAKPELTWGDPRSWTGLIDLVTASEESSGSLRAGLNSMDAMIPRAISSVHPTIQTIGYLGLFLAGIGYLTLWKSQRKLTVAMSISALLFILGVSVYETRESTSFFLPVTTLVIIAMIAALSSIDRWCHGLMRGHPLIRGILIIFLVSRIVVSARVSFADSIHEDRFPRIWISQLLDCAPDGSIILTRRSDVFFIGSYLMQIEKRHDTSKVIIFQHLLSFRWYLEDLNRVGVESLSGDAWNQMPKDSREWNAAITELICRRSLRNRDVLVTDYDTINDVEMVRNQSVPIVPYNLFGLIPSSNSNRILLSLPEFDQRWTPGSRSNLGFQLDQAIQFNRHAGHMKQAERYREISERLWTARSGQ